MLEQKCFSMIAQIVQGDFRHDFQSGLSQMIIWTQNMGEDILGQNLQFAGITAMEAVQVEAVHLMEPLFGENITTIKYHFENFFQKQVLQL